MSMTRTTPIKQKTLKSKKARNSVKELKLFAAGHKEMCLISSTLHIPMPSLGRGAWVQALLERSTRSPAIN